MYLQVIHIIGSLLVTAGVIVGVLNVIKGKEEIKEKIKKGPKKGWIKIRDEARLYGTLFPQFLKCEGCKYEIKCFGNTVADLRAQRELALEN